jgi:molybdopterin biosynthesis enzyme
MAQLAAPVTSLAGREDYVRVRVETRPDGAAQAHPVAGGSGDIVGFIRADGLVQVLPDVTALAAGWLVRVDLLD